MLLPLSIQKKFGIKVLTFPGGDYSCGLFCNEFYNYFDKNSFSEIFRIIIKNSTFRNYSHPLLMYLALFQFL